MDRINNVDLRAALLDIARINTYFHLENDLNISIEQMEHAAMLDDPAEKALLWVSYPSGIDCYSERQVFQRETRAYNGVLYHANNIHNDRRLAYAVEVTGVKDGKVYGNLFEMDLEQYTDHVRGSVLPSHTIRLYTGDPRDNNKQDLMSKAEFDRRMPLDLPKMTHWRNEPDNPAALQALLDGAWKEREANCTPVSDLQYHTSNLYDSRLAYYTDQLMRGINKLREPNSPDKQAFSVSLNPNITAFFDAELYSQLLDRLPYQSAAFSIQRGQRDMQLVIPRDEVLRERKEQAASVPDEKRVVKPSLIAQVKNPPAREQPGDRPAHKRVTGMEV